MIKWFKRKKKEDRGAAPENIGKKEAVEEEGPPDEETLLEEMKPFEEGRPTDEGSEPAAQEELEPEAEEGPPDWADEEAIPADAEDEAREKGGPGKGFFKRLRRGMKGTPEEEATEATDEGSEPAAQEELEAEASEDSRYWADEETTYADEEDETLGEGGRREGFFRRLRQRMKGTREKFVHRIDRLVLGKRIIDDELLEELEEILITSDLGVKTTEMLLRQVTDKVKRKQLSDPALLREQIRDEIRAVLDVEAPALDYRSAKPLIVMIVGVNGTGKTTTTGKLANQLKQQGLKTMLVACDTFRAAAVEQLSIWGERAGIPVIKQKGGSDPSAVAFDALDAAVSRDIDVVLMDTAGRMHTKVNLMEELKKIHRTVSKKMPGAPHQVFLVLDASTGQNALSQAKLFKQDIGLTGLILTKLDGTAKGGIIAAICDELQIPVRYIGIGEQIDDLRPFDPDEFTKALF